MTRRKNTKRTVRSWEIQSNRPGLRPAAAVEPWDMPLLVSEVVSESSAARRANDRQTWDPMVIVTVKGRWNGTDQTAELKLIIPATHADDIGAGIVIAGRHAHSDAAAGLLTDALDNDPEAS